jgi:hypothetical protein
VPDDDSKKVQNLRTCVGPLENIPTYWHGDGDRLRLCLAGGSRIPDLSQCALVWTVPQNHVLRQKQGTRHLLDCFLLYILPTLSRPAEVPVFSDCISSNMGSLFLPDTYELESVSSADEKLASIAWGFTLGFSLLTATKAARQTYKIYKRTKSLNVYVTLIWGELVVSTVFGFICWFYLNGNFAPR